MRSRVSLDSVAIGTLLVLAALLGLVIFFGAQAGVRITVTLPEGGTIGPFQQLQLTFSEAVDPDLAEALISIQPPVDGNFNWLDSRTLQFVPTRPFEPGADYKLGARPGNLSTRGSVLKKEQSWDFRVRDPMVVYLLSGNEQSTLWKLNLSDNSTERISPEDLKILSFDTSRDGEFLVFTTANEKKGIDLWQLSRAGNDASLLLDCGIDRCTTPVISPDGARVAYVREAAGPGPDLPFGSPRIWVLDLQSRQNSAVYEDPQIIGYGPVWSPDSSKLSSYDGLADQIRLLDLQTGEQFIFPSGTGGAITWSPDSTRFLFTDVEQNVNGLITRIRLADLPLNDTSTLIGDSDVRDYAYSSLAWSPVDDSFALGLRATEEKPYQVFSVIDIGILDGIVIADEEDFTYSTPSWDPWGNALLFQQFKLRGTFKPEIALWKPGFNEPLVIAQGILPHWLP